MSACFSFEAARPGTVWGGMPCKNCDFKKKDHSATAIRAHAKKQPAIDYSWRAVNTAPKKKIGLTPGMTKGSLAYTMGLALNQKHVGKSSGLVKTVYVDKEETRAYHSNLNANRGMAKAMAEMAMKGPSSNTKVGRYMAKKQGVFAPASSSFMKCASAGCDAQRSIKGYCGPCFMRVRH